MAAIQIKMVENEKKMTDLQKAKLKLSSDILSQLHERKIAMLEQRQELEKQIDKSLEQKKVNAIISAEKLKQEKLETAEKIKNNKKIAAEKERDNKIHKAEREREAALEKA
jgi:hypothetical protein